MNVKNKSVHVPWGAFITALIGLVWCAWLAFPGAPDSLCLSNGCAVFQDFTVFGLSLWWAGVAFFFLLAILCLQGKQMLAWWLARTALVLDSFLLIIMLFFAPCANCLVVAFLLAIALILSKPHTTSWIKAPSHPTVLLSVWFGLFLANSFLLGSSLIPAWQINKQENALVHVYFSPSCPACKKALETFEGSAAFYPVNEKPEDILSIYRLNLLVKKGFPLTEALQKSLDPNFILPAPNAFELTVLNILLMRNRTTTLVQGNGTLPLIKIYGMPKAWEKNSLQSTTNTLPTATMLQNTPTSQPAAEPEALPWDTGETGSCSQNTPEPCPE